MCLSVSTDATSEKDLEAIVRDLWANGSDVAVMEVGFYPNGQGASTGMGMAFENEEAAAVTFRGFPPAFADPENNEAVVRETMQNGGIYVVPTEALIDDTIEEECANWDTAIFGSPPPEWDCPGD